MAAAAVSSSVSVTSRVLVRGIATGRVGPQRVVGAAVGTSIPRRRYHVSSVSRGMKLSSAA